MKHELLDLNISTKEIGYPVRVFVTHKQMMMQ